MSIQNVLLSEYKFDPENFVLGIQLNRFYNGMFAKMNLKSTQRLHVRMAFAFGANINTLMWWFNATRLF